MTKDQEISSVIDRLIANDLTSVQLKWYLSKWEMAVDDFFAMAKKRCLKTEVSKTKDTLYACLMFLTAVYVACSILVGFGSGHLDLLWIFR